MVLVHNRQQQELDYFDFYNMKKIDTEAKEDSSLGAGSLGHTRTELRKNEPEE